MTEQEKRLHRRCFAGHRPEGILLSETTAKAWPRFQIQQAIDADYVTFITGMGMGVDIWAAQIVIDLRAANPSLHLIAVEPYPGFAAKWTEAWRDAYDQVVRNADLVKRVSQTYDPEAINARISWMVDHASRLIAIYNGSKGYTGTFVDYARAHGLDIISIPSRVWLRKYRIIESCRNEMNFSRLQTANFEGLLAASQEISRQQAAEIQPLMRHEHCAVFP